MSAPKTVVAGSAFTFTVSADPSYSGWVSIVLSDGSTPPPKQQITHGPVTFTATLNKVDPAATITATDTVTTSITGKATVQVLPYFVVSAPSTAASGSPFTFTVTAKDGGGVVAGYAGHVAFTSSDGSATFRASDGSALPSGGSQLTSGTGTFQATLPTAGTQSITVTDTTGATGTTSVTVTPGEATRFSLSAPSWVSPGSSFALTVTALDQYGNVATGFNGTVWLKATDPLATLSASSQLTSGQGTVWAVLRTGGYQTITARAHGLSGTTTVAVGPPWYATHFNVYAPSTVTAGVPFTMTVTAVDAYGNTATGYGGVVRFASSGWPATLPANSMLYGGSGSFTVTLWSTGTEVLTATDTANAAISGTSNAITVVPAVAVSPPAPAPSQLPPNQQFVEQVYHDLLGRSADPAGLVTWTAALASGVPRSEVAAAILASPEYRAQQVTGAYSDCLGRTPDPAGLSLYTSMLGQGWTPEALEAALVGSDEYFVTHGGTVPAWVAATYQDVLGRAPDPAGLAFWSYLAGAGVPRTQIAAAIEASGEYRALFVTSLYQALLGRSPAPTEVSYWAQVMANGATDGQVIAAFVGSPEYLVHAM